MTEQRQPHVTVIYQDVQRDQRPTCLEIVLYVVGILVIFWVMTGGLLR